MAQPRKRKKKQPQFLDRVETWIFDIIMVAAVSAEEEDDIVAADDEAKDSGFMMTVTTKISVDQVLENAADAVWSLFVQTRPRLASLVASVALAVNQAVMLVEDNSILDYEDFLESIEYAQLHEALIISLVIEPGDKVNGRLYQLCTRLTLVPQNLGCPDMITRCLGLVLMCDAVNSVVREGKQPALLYDDVPGALKVAATHITRIKEVSE